MKTASMLLSAALSLLLPSSTLTVLSQTMEDDGSLTSVSAPNSSNTEKNEEKVFSWETAPIDIRDTTILDLSNQDYTRIDLTGFSNLKYLDVSSNKLTSLDLSPCPDLICVDCSKNQISQLTFGEDCLLEALDCSDNALPCLDLSQQGDLKLQGNEPLPWPANSSYSTRKTVTSLSPQTSILPSNMTMLSPKDQFPGWSLFRVQDLTATAPAVYYPEVNRIENLTKNAQVHYSYDTMPGSSLDLFKMNVTLKLTGPEDDSLNPKKPEEKPLLPFEDGDPLNGEKPEIESIEMNRLYNPNSGEHFYTADLHEKKVLVSLGWKDEGTGWIAPETSRTPVYRLYNSNAGDHHYTIAVHERDELRRLGWTYEGIGWYSDDAKGVPLYRQYNPNAVAGAHNYTTDRNENDTLVSLGWSPEGISWYGLDPSELDD